MSKNFIESKRGATLVKGLHTQSTTQMTEQKKKENQEGEKSKLIEYKTGESLRNPKNSRNPATENEENGEDQSYKEKLQNDVGIGYKLKIGVFLDTSMSRSSNKQPTNYVVITRFP